MKKIAIALVCFLMNAASIFCIKGYAGATIFLSNYESTIPIFLIWSQDSQTTNLFFQVLGGPVGGPLIPLNPINSTNTVFNRHTDKSAPGYFDGGIGIVPGVAGGAEAEFFVRAWIGLPGSTFEDATIKGETAHWIQTTGSGDPLAEPPLPLTGPPLNVPATIPYSGNNHYLFSTATSPNGNISVDPQPGIAGFAKGTQITVTAQASSNYFFAGWKGISDTNNVLSIVIEKDIYLEAIFRPIWTLTVTATEGGSVTVDPKQTEYRDQQWVQIKAQPIPGYTFKNWSGDAFAKYASEYFEPTIRFLISSNMNLVAHFSPSPPVITVQPTRQTVTEGAMAIFTIQATGTNLTYQWYRNKIAIPDATNSIYSLITTRADGGTFYSCSVSNLYARANSVEAYLSVVPIYINIHISHFQVTPNNPRLGDTIVINPWIYITPSSMINATTYQWYKDNISIPGATNLVYSIANASTNANGKYYLKASLNSVSTLSPNFYLSIPEPLVPSFYSHPKNQTIKLGQDVTFSAEVYWEPYYYNQTSFSWFYNGVEIAGATNKMLKLVNVTTNDSGSYVCRATNPMGLKDSMSAILTILTPPPRIMNQPQNLKVYLGEPITLKVDAIGAKPLSYQWMFNGVPIPNATYSKYTKEHAELEDAGQYSVAISDIFGTTNSSSAQLVVQSSPKIIEEPRSQIVAEGITVNFWIRTSGLQPMSYQWRFQGTDIPGENKPILTITNVTAANNGVYQVEVKNQGGTRLSSAAFLTVTPYPQVLNIQMSEGVLTLALKTKPGKHYSIQQSLDLLIWTNLGSVDSTTDISEFKTAISEKRMFYRVTTEQ